MDEEQPNCRLCGASFTRRLGPIPESDFFAGKVLPMPLPGGSLWVCLVCHSKFRYPILQEREYQRLYENGAPCHWTGLKDRQDIQAVVRLLRQEEGLISVLDVGCGTGNLLDSLPSQIAKFGVDPSPSVSQAAEKGISVLGASLDCIPLGTQFDAITVIDVIEHLADPTALLDRAYMLLSPGGLMVLSTGDPGAKAWQRFPQYRFWYSSFPEHVSFPSGEFFDTWARRRGVESIEKQLIRYRQLSPVGKLFGLIVQMIFVASPSLLSSIGHITDRLRDAPQPHRRHFSPGVPGLFLDHQIIIIRKPTNLPLIGSSVGAAQIKP